MGIIQRFQRKIGFTRNESYVVLFLTSSLLVGGGIQLARSVTGTNFDYTEEDQEFERRSILLAAEDSLGGSEGYGSNRDSVSIKTSKNKKDDQSRKLRLPGKEQININSATKQQLMQLPGIGEATAERIILYREEHGPFSSVQQLMEVKGIGKKKLERLLPFIAVGD